MCLLMHMCACTTDVNFAHPVASVLFLLPKQSYMRDSLELKGEPCKQDTYFLKRNDKSLVKLSKKIVRA